MTQIMIMVRSAQTIPTATMQAATCYETKLEDMNKQDKIVITLGKFSKLYGHVYPWLSKRHEFVAKHTIKNSTFC